jgi:tetratricopeptide (TPR) repeat protein
LFQDVTASLRPERLAGRRGWRLALAALGLLLAGCNADGSGAGMSDGDGGVTGASPAGSYLAGRQAERRFDLEAAARFLAYALDHDPDNMELRQRTFLLLVTGGRFAEALPHGKILLARRPGASVETMTELVEAVRGGDFREAERLIGTLDGRRHNTLIRPLVLAWIKVGLGDVEGALSTLAPLANDRGLALLHALHRALITDVTGHASADEAYRALMDRSGEPTLRMVQLLGNRLERQGAPDQAQALYDAYRRRQPELVVLTAQPAGTKPAPLIVDARRGLSEALFNLAGAFYQEHDVGLGLVYARLATHVWPEGAMSKLLLGEILEEQSRDEEAIRIYRSIGANGPLAHQARIRLARVLGRTERVDEAVAELQRLASETPTQADALIALGHVLRGAERFAESVSAYDRAMERIGRVEPEHWRLVYSRGIALERSKQWERAEAALGHALELRPEDPYVLNYLGYSWVDRGLHLERAEAMIRRATELRPEDGFIADSLGWVYYRTGRFERAVVELERAVALEPEDPVINEHLGDAYWQVGRFSEARFQWQRALRFKPEAERIADLQSKLGCQPPGCPKLPRSGG